ncbi:MAG: hypothetical protein KGO47_08645 [Cyanobacteria bacterium REEB417]|nr:hypothetical protein [Cyanobacteria bacterium REEB417]
MIEWNGGRLELPRLGYLTVDEMQSIRAIDPQNALYRLITAKAVELSQAAPDFSPHQCYGFLVKLHAQDLGARGRRSSPEEEALQVEHAAIIGPFLEEARAIANRVTIRAVTVILNRIRPGWTDEQTCRLPGPLLSLLHAFEQEEERAGVGQADDPQAEMRALEEALGKLQEVIDSTATDPTGDGPSGSAADSGPEPLSSAASASESSPVATSSRRSRKGIAPKGIASTAKN